MIFPSTVSKKYVMDESLSWEERYKQLEAHHIEETTELIEKIRCLRITVNQYSDTLEMMNDLAARQAQQILEKK